MQIVFGYSLIASWFAVAPAIAYREIEILTKQNKMLRKQVDELRQQLEVTYAAIYKQE